MFVPIRHPGVLLARKNRLFFQESVKSTARINHTARQQEGTWQHDGIAPNLGEIAHARPQFL
jgi:hypothetical protein